MPQDRSWRKIAKELHETEKTQEKRKIMRVMSKKEVRVGGRDVTIQRYDVKFQGHNPGDFEVLEWSHGWSTVGNGTSVNMADAVAQAKTLIQKGERS